MMMAYRLGIALAASMALGAFSVQQPVRAADGPAPLRAVFHVDEADPVIHKRALGNISNFFDGADLSGRTAFVKLVVNASGIDMLLRDRGAVSDRLAVMEVEFPNLEVVVCQRSLDWREQAEGAPPDVIDMAHLTDSGVVYIAELQAEGWAYIKP